MEIKREGYTYIQTDLMNATDDPNKKYRQSESYGSYQDILEMVLYHAERHPWCSVFLNGRCVHAGNLTPLDIQRFTDAWKL